MRTIYAAALSALVGLSAGVAGAEKPVAESARSTAVKPLADQRGPSARVKAQQEAMKALAFLDGEWRGVSRTKRRDGWVAMVQSERVTTMLDGTVKQIEVRGYNSDGTLTFEALRILSYDPGAKAYRMRSYQGGGERNHQVTLKADGLSWTVGSGRSAVRYDATVKDGVWRETATRVPGDGGEPETYFEFAVRRMKPGAGPVSMALAAAGPWAK